MKHLILTLIAILAIQTTITAQESRRSSAVESLANSVIESPSLDDFTAAAFQSQSLSRRIFKDGTLANKFAASLTDPLILEITYYKTLKDSVRRLLNTTYSSLTAEDIKAIEKHISSKAYQCITSNRFWSGVNATHFKFCNEYINNTYKNTKEFNIKDAEFSELCDEYYNSLNEELISSKFFVSLTERGNRYPAGKKIKNDTKFKIKIYKHYLNNFLSKEQMSELVEFVQKASPSMLEATNRITQILIGSDENFFIPLSEEQYKSIDNNDYIEYANYRRNARTSTFEPYRETATIKYKGGSYIGEVFNGKADGEGTYTDKNGTKYTGTFKDNRMHGCYTVELSDGTSTLELWAEDKKMETQCIAADESGTLFPVPEYKNSNGETKAMGYGYHSRERYIGEKNQTFGQAVISQGDVYKASITNKGMIIDDRIEGEGEQIIKNEYLNSYKSGTFKNGELIKGTELSEDDHRIINFKKEVKDNRIQGAYKILLKEDNVEMSFTGKKIKEHNASKGANGLTIIGEGDGEYKFKNNNTGMRLSQKGFFIYHKLFGQGIETIDSDSTTRLIYNGEFINGEKTGKGKLYVIIKNKGKSGFTINDVAQTGISLQSDTSSLSATLVGDFDNNKFIKGEIFSTKGDTLQGIFKDGRLIEGSCNTGDFGQSIIEISTGSSYCGEIKDGRPNGKGRLTLPDGKILEGRFKDGTLEQ